MSQNNSRVSALWREGISLIPYPQEVAIGGDDFVFGDEVTIVLDEDAPETDKFTGSDLVERLEELGINAKLDAGESNIGGEESEIGNGNSESGACIVLTRKTKDLPDKLGEQGYLLATTEKSLTISARGEAGLFYGSRTLLQIIQTGRGRQIIKGMEIADYPDIPYRAAGYDTKHHQDKASYVKGFIRQLADYKINMLVWEWEDKFAYKSHPEIGAPGAFTMEEMQEFTRYARKFHIQLVPLVQGLGHASNILKWPQNAHLREIPASNWEFCPLKEETYELLFDLWKEAIEATPGSEFLHIGTDETYELGLGEECGCKAKAAEIGKRGLSFLFINRCAEELQKLDRKTIAWHGHYIPGEKFQPAKGLITTRYTGYPESPKTTKDAGYPVWAFDPNSGLEHLFMAYLFRSRGGKEIENCLKHSYNRVTVAANSGLYEGVINPSWDDTGLHNQVWMMSYVNTAEWSWSGSAPELDEFIDKYFVNYYGPKARDMHELWVLLSKGSYYYMDTLERRVWHHGDVGKMHLPDLPRGDSVEFNPFWNREYSEILKRSRHQFTQMQRALQICRANLQQGVKNSYDFELFITIAELIAHTARTHIALSDLENAVAQAHIHHYTSHCESYRAMGKAVEIIQTNLKGREEVLETLVAIWEKTRLPKGMSTPDKKFFHQQDRARHYALRRSDMTYFICDEQMLGLEDYLAKLRDYMAWYKNAYLDQ